MSFTTDSRSSEKHKSRMFTFKPHEIVKIEAIGNQIRNIDCPTPRSGHRIVAAKGNIYSFGGYTPITVDETVEHILFKELWVYNCASKTWRRLETSGNAPEELASHCACYVNNHLLIFGGTVYPFGEKSSNDVHICNLKTLQWSKLETTGSPPPKNYGQAMAIHGDNVYVVGGTTGYTYSADVHCLNLTTKEWKLLYKTSRAHRPKTFEPEPRYRHEIAIEDNKIYVFGGGTALASFSLTEIPVFDLENNSWFKVITSGSNVARRRCHSLVQVESDVYICGGLNGHEYYSDICKINLKTLVWQKLEVKLPYPLYFHTACLSDSNQLFIFGGVNALNPVENCRTNDLHTMWPKIPSLTTLSWQAILHYVPHISCLPKQKLFEVGVPMHCLNEIEFYSSSTPLEVFRSIIEDPDETWEML